MKTLTWYVQFPNGAFPYTTRIRYNETKQFDFKEPVNKQAFKSFLKRKYYYKKGLPNKTQIWCSA